MGVLIEGMEMPKEGFVEVLIRDDGTVQQTGQSYRIDGTDYYTPYVGEMPVMYKAVPVPSHGDLIDRDAIINALQELFDKRARDAEFTGNRGACVTWNDAIYHIKSASTFIPAERAEEDE